MVTPTKEEVVIERGDGGMGQEAVSGEQVTAAVQVSAGLVREAAQDAADKYGVDKVEENAQHIAEAWKRRLMQQIQENRRRVRELQKEQQQNGALEAAGPTTVHGALGLYQWWDVLLAGPFQTVGALGPFLPSKIMRHNETAFMIALIVRNPNPLPGGPNPSAAQLMTGLQYRVKLQTGNLTTWDAGPSFAQDGGFGAGFINIHIFNLTGFDIPATHEPDLYEGNLVMDVKGPGGGLPPFAGYSTWVLDPDIELPDLFTPGLDLQIQPDIPARFMLFSAERYAPQKEQVHVESAQASA